MRVQSENIASGRGNYGQVRTPASPTAPPRSSSVSRPRDESNDRTNPTIPRGCLRKTRLARSGPPRARTRPRRARRGGARGGAGWAMTSRAMAAAVWLVALVSLAGGAEGQLVQYTDNATGWTSSESGGELISDAQCRVVRPGARTPRASDARARAGARFRANLRRFRGARAPGRAPRPARASALPEPAPRGAPSRRPAPLFFFPHHHESPPPLPPTRLPVSSIARATPPPS